MMDIHGTCDPKFEQVKTQFVDNFSGGNEIGASVAVELDGNLLVDLWAGFSDGDGLNPWQSDTLANVFSMTRTLVALIALILEDSGEVDLDLPVARYWPSFSAAGKECIAVRDVLGHTAGLPTWDTQMKLSDLYDWEYATAELANQPPLWKPRTAAGYHALTQGYIIGEIVRRVTGEEISSFFARNISRPLSAEFYLGIPDDAAGRLATIVPSTSFTGDEIRSRVPQLQSSISWKTTNNPAFSVLDAFSAEWRRASIPAVGGYGNARSVAKIQSILACGGSSKGVRMISESSCRRVLQEQYDGMDLVLNRRFRYGIGFALSSEAIPLGEGTCWWGGLGGSFVAVDLENGMVVAYVMNYYKSRLSGRNDPRGLSLYQAARNSL